MKLVELDAEVNEVGVRILRNEYEVVKETEKMFMVTGGWRKRIDKGQMGIKEYHSSCHAVCYRAIVPIEKEKETVKKMKEQCLQCIEQMQKELTALSKKAKEWK